jgi:MerR family transcriptional regulator, thiopeptide resistance regulator
MTLTVTRLARECKLSRTTVLYYESIGLLRRPRRSDGNYRVYTAQDLDRLRQICAYRDAGLALADIRAVLDAPPSDAAAVLRRRMLELNVEIERMRDHQRSIAQLLKLGKDTEMVTKQKWTAIMSAAGFSEEDMRRWHREFEKSAPAEHQEFLEFLHIPSDEIQVIRTWSSQR